MTVLALVESLFSSYVLESRNLVSKLRLFCVYSKREVNEEKSTEKTRENKKIALSLLRSNGCQYFYRHYNDNNAKCIVTHTLTYTLSEIVRHCKLHQLLGNVYIAMHVYDNPLSFHFSAKNVYLVILKRLCFFAETQESYLAICHLTFDLKTSRFFSLSQKK